MTAVGYIGLGMMGSAMAECLLNAGLEVHVFDLDRTAVDRAVASGAIAKESAAEVAASSEVVSICVPAAPHVESVLTGDSGIVDGAHAALTVLIHSTIHPDSITAAARTAADWGVPVFDACIAGGPDAARLGESVLLVGGSAEMSGQVRGLLDVYADKVVDGGPVGAGAALKIGVNVMAYLQQAAARSAFRVVEGAGGDTDGLVEAWRHIGQLGRLTEQYLGLLAVPTEDIEGDFRRSLERLSAIGQKDLRLATELGSAGPALDEVLEAMIEAMPTVMGVD